MPLAGKKCPAFFRQGRNPVTLAPRMPFTASQNNILEGETGEIQTSRGQHAFFKSLRTFKLSSNWSKLMQEAPYEKGLYKEQVRTKKRATEICRFWIS